MALTAARNLIEIILMTAGAIFIFVLTTPHIYNLTAAANPPEIWNSMRSWLRPPFLYLVVNGIIISIAASSRLFHHHHQIRTEEFHFRLRRRSARAVYPSPEPTGTLMQEPLCEEAEFDYYNTVLENDRVAVAEVVTYDETTTLRTKQDGELMMVEANDDFAPDDVSGLVVASPLKRRETLEIATSFFESQIKEPSPLPSSGRRSTPTRVALEGGNPLEGEQETLESIWKRITEGRQVTRHLQQSDTGKDNGRQIASSEPSTPSSVKKSETFKERRRMNLSPSTKRINREPSLSQDELNRRVEAFINKFNQEMRLQRQHSIKRLINPNA
ncbi:hypothetical protein V2J09_001727 [Rumex salicifolius]